MGNYLFRHGKQRRREYRYRETNRCDDFARYDDITPSRGPRIPGAAVLGGIALWSLLALGLWAAVDPLLAWAAGVAGPAIDLGVGFARWFGLGREAAVLRDTANVEGLIGWAVGPVHFLVKAGLLLTWIAGMVALIAVPAILRRRSRW